MRGDQGDLRRRPGVHRNPVQKQPGFGPGQGDEQAPVRNGELQARRQGQQRDRVSRHCLHLRPQRRRRPHQGRRRQGSGGGGGDLEKDRGTRDEGGKGFHHPPHEGRSRHGHRSPQEGDHGAAHELRSRGIRVTLRGSDRHPRVQGQRPGPGDHRSRRGRGCPRQHQEGNLQAEAKPAGCGNGEADP